jgi:hypothetical protein
MKGFLLSNKRVFTIRSRFGFREMMFLFEEEGILVKKVILIY